MEIQNEDTLDGCDVQLEQDLADIKNRIQNMQNASWTQTLTSDNHVVETIGTSDDDYKSLIREKLREAWRKMHKAESSANKTDSTVNTTASILHETDSTVNKAEFIEFSPLQEQVASPMLSHHDVYHLCATQIEERQRQEIYCLHILNNVLQQRARVVRNNERLAEGADVEARDQGFTRPRILILVPFRNTALDIVRVLGSLWQSTGGQVDNQKRLLDEFGPPEEDSPSANKPADYLHTFRHNIDDCFRFGIKCTRKSMKLFCDFYSSDIIVASPLGLRFIIDGQSETKKINLGQGRSKKKRIVKKGDSDFLSSIQMLIVEQADVISMQNWEHLLHVVAHLNKLPKGAHGCDFSRVQNHFLDELAAHTRQNIVFSEFEFPELNGFLKGLGNCMGKWKYTVASQGGLLKKGKQALPQFHLIDAASHDLIPSARFAYFTENILPKYAHSASHVCIFISSYLDFVQVREHLQQLELAHVVLSEYSSQQEISTARTTFFNGKARFLLVSERFHFFKRYSIRGIRKLIYYSLPEHAAYYEDWCEMLKDKTDVPILVSKYDYLKAERIVGTKKMSSLFQS
ncbi:hypothetical protein PSACC_01252 [Paramicrosporidium saccamoebae]|uniref:U3 small nucleolar RNA-associated protein 25 n=1 Tax=Paramicrosporidium saccamoebae TaxID=1246581 RepID=A0A2H9TMI6_9FUNG|nr:hypothetical protein PSACC_01252 [Paramicrosporidium saccamoebae]